MAEDKPKAVFSADLVMGKVFEAPVVDEKGKRVGSQVKEVMFNVTNSEGVLTPRINLEGSFFSDFLMGGRPEQYKVTLTITAERTDYEQKGISEKEEPIPANETPVVTDGPEKVTFPGANKPRGFGGTFKVEDGAPENQPLTFDEAVK